MVSEGGRVAAGCVRMRRRQRMNRWRDVVRKRRRGEMYRVRSDMRSNMRRDMRRDMRRAEMRRRMPASGMAAAGVAAAGMPALRLRRHGGGRAKHQTDCGKTRCNFR